MPRHNPKVPVPLRLAKEIVDAVEAKRTSGQTRTDVIEEILREKLLGGRRSSKPTAVATRARSASRKAPSRTPDPTALCPTHKTLVRSGHRCLTPGCQWFAP